MDKDNHLIIFEKYLRRRFPERRTPIDYLSDIRQFMAQCQKPWRDITMQDIDAFVDQQRTDGLKSTTISRRVAALKTFFDFLAEESGDLSWPNPVRFKRHAGKYAKRLPRDLRDEDIERIWNMFVSPRDRAWFVLMVRAGLRVGEVVDLKISDLLNKPHNDQPARLRVNGKGRKERIVLLSFDAYAVLETWLEQRPTTESEHVFLNERNRPLSANGIEWLLHGYGKQAGIDLTPHQLRHTFARQLTEAGMPVTSLGKLLGHAQITTTQIYTAGANPELAQAYQAAMQHLAAKPVSQSAASTASVPPVSSSTHSPASPVAAKQTHPPRMPDWNAWGLDLPETIRETCLIYVQRRLHRWPAARRRERALNILNELLRLWQWFTAHRPIDHPGQVGLKDLWDYQIDQQLKGLSAKTINRRLDYVLGIARELSELVGQSS